MKSHILILTLTALSLSSQAAEPIRLHPENPHYFLWRDKPTVLIGSGEHYGAVINLDFGYSKYLETLKADGLNQIRIFSGTLREVPGSFGIVDNTLAPAVGRYVCPWARSEVPGYAQGGNKFDLTKWDEAYFTRLKEVVGEAGKRGIVIEFVLFTPLYVDPMWEVSPMNAKNNVNGIGAIPKDECLTLKHANLVAVQETVTRKLVQELNGFDNVYFEICNEPYARKVPRDWEAHIARTIAETEKGLPNKHLIAQNIANGSVKIEKPDPLVSIFNFHYASPPDAVTVNYGLNKPIGHDETGFKGNGDAVYRKEAWQFILNGGSIFSHLDYSFTVGQEGGDYSIPAKTPGGGGKAFRHQMKVLKEFVEGADFVRMKPARELIKADGAVVYALAEAGKSYAAYLKGRAQNASLDLPAGNYRATWVNVLQGNIEKAEDFTHAGGEKALAIPEYNEEIALKVQRAAAAK